MRHQHRPMRQGTQRKDHAYTWWPLELALEVSVAGVHLVALRLVLGRYAFHRVGDAAVCQEKAIVTG